MVPSRILRPLEVVFVCVISKTIRNASRGHVKTLSLVEFASLKSTTFRWMFLSGLASKLISKKRVHPTIQTQREDLPPVVGQY